ncbi:hypothetical protein [Tenacibaculum sp. SDUM215027]|uniref:hypothetical protein n=1 Tax=Tenacibaculum sp. SDUM215027 TaxID=3422596 RepID=UPI003D31D4E5
MARVLYWNIEQFGINKINNPSMARQTGSTLSRNVASGQRLWHILNTFFLNIPDIFVVVETSTGAGNGEGSLITAGGRDGALELLNLLRVYFGNQWKLVPPLILGGMNRTEGISVYYNSNNLNFSGPWGWQGGGNASDSVANIGAGNLVTYANPWDNCLPATLVPQLSPINPGVNSNRLAGQWQFRGVPPLGGGLGPLLNFPAADYRPPFLTTFWDAANNRTIKLFAYHAPPHNPAAANGTNTISQIDEIINLGANEVAVVVGDFNVDINDAPNVATAYNNLVGLGYTRHINPSPAPATYPAQGYVSTHMKQGGKRGATPWDTNGYPAYGYAVTEFRGRNTSSIDNILTRYGGLGAGGPAANMTIVNRVTGTPYNLDPNPPVGVPAGHYAYTTGMVQIPVGIVNAGAPVALPLPPNGPNGVGGYTPGNIGALSYFRGWDNYGKIRSTSDHMALIIDI